MPPTISAAAASSSASADACVANATAAAAASATQNAMCAMRLRNERLPRGAERDLAVGDRRARTRRRA